jgi:adenylate cyclase
MSGLAVRLAVLFADVVGSTTLYEQIGDERARAQVGRILAALEDLTRRHHGRVVKSMGDGVMCVFGSGLDASECASGMVEAAAGGPRAAACGEADGRLLPLRVGVHFGEVLAEAGDYFGDTVNVAARLVGLAGNNEVLLSREVVDRLPRELHLRVGFLDHVVVKGRQQPVEVYRLLPEGVDNSVTVVSSRKKGFNREARLELLAEGVLHILDYRRPSIEIGRGAQCDIRVDDQEVSRLHARIELRGGAFFVVDKSANGTYVTQITGEHLALHRGELRLSGAGSITIGSTPVVIPYRVVS